MTRSNKAERKAYDYMKNQIITGNWPPLTKVTEQKVSDFLKMSRSPVRSAIKDLASEGLLTVEPYKGAVVSKHQLTQQEFVDRMEMFELLLQQYVLLVEKRHLHLNEEYLESYIHKIDDAIEHHESKGKISYIGNQLLESLLVEQPNQYIRQILVSIGEDILQLDYSLGNQQSYPLYHIFIEGIHKMVDDIAQEEYNDARKEIRLFVNHLLLQAIEQQKVSS